MKEFIRKKVTIKVNILFNPLLDKDEGQKDEGNNSIHLVSQNNNDKSLIDLVSEKKDFSSPYSPPHNNQDFKSKVNKEDAEKQPMIELSQIKDPKNLSPEENKDSSQIQNKRALLEKKMTLLAKDLNVKEKINEQQIFKKDPKEENKKEEEIKKPPDSPTKV